MCARRPGPPPADRQSNLFNFIRHSKSCSKDSFATHASNHHATTPRTAARCFELCEPGETTKDGCPIQAFWLEWDTCRSMEDPGTWGPGSSCTLLAWCSYQACGRTRSAPTRGGSPEKIAARPLFSDIVTYSPIERWPRLFPHIRRRGHIAVEGNNNSALLYGVNWYLKYVAHLQISTNGSFLRCDVSLPAPPQVIMKESPYRFRYALNQNVDGYTSPYWDGPRWQHEIDILALSGINALLIERGKTLFSTRPFASSVTPTKKSASGSPACSSELAAHGQSVLF